MGHTEVILVQVLQLPRQVPASTVDPSRPRASPPDTGHRGTAAPTARAQVSVYTTAYHLFWEGVANRTNLLRDILISFCQAVTLFCLSSPDGSIAVDGPGKFQGCTVTAGVSSRRTRKAAANQGLVALSCSPTKHAAPKPSKISPRCDSSHSSTISRGPPSTLPNVDISSSTVSLTDRSHGGCKEGRSHHLGPGRGPGTRYSPVLSIPFASLFPPSQAASPLSSPIHSPTSPIMTTRPNIYMNLQGRCVRRRMPWLTSPLCSGSRW